MEAKKPRKDAAGAGGHVGIARTAQIGVLARARVGHRTGMEAETAACKKLDRALKWSTTVSGPPHAGSRFEPAAKHAARRSAARRGAARDVEREGAKGSNRERA